MIVSEYKSVQKYLNGKKKKELDFKKNPFIPFINKLLVSGVILIVCLCLVKLNPTVKSFIEKHVYSTNFSFAKINDTYKKYFGNILPITGLGGNDTAPVFHEKIVYSKKEDYKEGVKLTVGSDYLVPVLESGIIVFMGNKDNYGHVVIVQQVNGIDLWYVGVNTSNLNIYDYIEKGSLLGESASSEIYLYFQKSGEFLNYKEHFS